MQGGFLEGKGGASGRKLLSGSSAAAVGRGPIDGLAAKGFFLMFAVFTV